MYRVSKAILIVLATLLAAVMLLLLAVNLYVQSPGTQARIQEELSKALKLPLVITNTSFTPWSDLRINGISVPSASPKAEKFLEASSFSARYRFLPLLRRHLVIDEMRLESPRIVWVQNAEGRWVLPPLPKNASASEKKADKPKDSTPRDKSIEVQLDGLSIHHGSIEFFDQQMQRVALLSDVEMNSSVLSAERIEGRLSVGKLNYLDLLFFQDVRSAFSFLDGQLTLPALEAALANGRLTGNFTVHPDAPLSPFSAALKVEKVDAARLSTEAGWQPGQASGILAGTLELHGNSRQASRAEGHGQLGLSGGQFRQLEFFQTIGQLLQIDELASLRLQNASADFRLANERATVDSLLLEAYDLKLSAQGTVRLDGKLSLDARLAVNEVLAKKLPNFVRSTLTDTDANGLPSIAFKISGRANNPHTDLAEKIVGKKLGDQFESVVSALFGGKKKADDKKKDDKKKKKSKDAPPAVPAAVPEVDAPEPPESAPTPVPAPSAQ